VTPVPAIVRDCDALVLSAAERADATSLVAAAVEGGASVAITAGTRPTRLIAGGEERELAPGEVSRPRDDLGAGDVFAAAFFLLLATGAAPAAAAEVAGAAAAVRVLGDGAGAVADWAAIERRLSVLASGAPGAS
jgi:sugar/nucleoside kinase (ribokinase family)